MISEIHLYLKFILRKINPCALILSYFGNVNDFFVTVFMAVKLPHPTLYSVILSYVCFLTHLYEDVNEIMDSSHIGFSVSVENIFTKEFLTINTWV